MNIGAVEFQATRREAFDHLIEAFAFKGDVVDGTRPRTRLDIARHLQATLGERFAPPQVLIDKVAAGELGKKTGKGFYDWS